MSRASFRSINYKLRSSKYIERKLIGVFLRKLSVFSEVSNYQYIGFGSIYFTDFFIFHREFGIDKMISIEKEDTEQNKKRIKFNKPFSCIDVIFGDSKDVLPDLDYSVRSNIVWLDYDSKLNSSSLEDVETISAKLGHGDLFVMSINVACPDRNLDELKQNVGSENIPRDAKKIDVGAKDMAKTCKKIVYDKIQANLIDRNLELGDEEKLAFSPLMYFYYRDGAPMATFGGIFVKEADLGSGIIDPFKELSFARIGDEFMQLESPCLTFKEIIELNQLLPGDTIDEIERKLPVPRSEIEHFEEIYKYFPYFLSIEGF